MRVGRGEAGGALVVGSILPSQPVHHRILRSPLLPPRPSGELCRKAATRSSPVGEITLAFHAKPLGETQLLAFFGTPGCPPHRCASLCLHRSPQPRRAAPCPLHPQASACCAPHPRLLAACCRPSQGCREQGDGWLCHLAPLGERKGIDGVPLGGRMSPPASLQLPRG